MTTLSAVITSTGISIPTYDEVLASLTASYQGIYGSDAVLTPDTQDGQFLAVLANVINDNNLAAVALYNAYSPTYAQGVGLSSQVKINGLQREAASYSTVVVTIAGDVGTEITNGVVTDIYNNYWNLPGTVTIPSNGSIEVTATAQVQGAISVGPGTVTGINTPTQGWQSVTNSASSVAGVPVEQDGELRARQALSTAAPSQSIEGGILAAVLNVAGVESARLYENDTSSVDSQGIPANSIAVVVLGGNLQDIVNAIGARKTPGTGTYGNTSGTYTDPEGHTGTINYFQMAQIPITVNITVRALTNYSATTSLYIAQAVSAFINALGNGEYSLLNRLYAPANLSGDAATNALGISQPQLDILSATYQILSLSQSRVSPPVNTHITGGPYAANAAAVSVDDTTDTYVGSVIAITLDNSTTFNATVQSVGGSSLGIYPPVPAGRFVPDRADVYLVSDVQINFNETATCVPANVVVTVTG